MNRKSSILLVWILVGLTLLVACGSTPEPEPTEPAKENLEGLWYPLSTGLPTLDMHMGADTTSQLVVGQCLEGLFEYRGDGSISPAGATDYAVSGDGLVYTVNLRQGAVWSDGVPVVAQHYVDGVIRLLKPETAAQYAWLMYDIEGAAAFNTGETDDPESVGIRSIDDHTLQITLAEPVSYFEMILPFAAFWPVRLDLIKEHGEDWTQAGNYVCNGAYLLDSWEPESDVVLVKNPTYWATGDVQIDKVTFHVVLEAATRLSLYEDDELHVSDWPAEETSRILEDPVLSQELRILPRPGVYYIGLNTLRRPTDNVLVRQALASAIDRKSLIEDNAQQPWRTPLSCTTPPRILGYQEWGTCGHSFDLEKAQQLLADAGYPDGESFPTLHLWYNGVSFNEDVIESVAAMWEENLNIEVESHITEWDVYLADLDKCNDGKKELAACELNAYRMGWVMDYGDPQNQLEVVFAPSSPFQYTGWENERYDELMDLAGSEFDQTKREAYYKEADRILCGDEAVIIPLISYDRSILVKGGVRFEYPPFGAPALKRWALP